MLKNNFLVNYLRSVYEEGIKVIWPTRTILVRHGIMVVSTITVAILVVAGIDYVFQTLLVKVLNQG
jgi:preprotein translocase SecE subunit